MELECIDWISFFKACEEFKAISRKLYDKPNCIEELAEMREWMKSIPDTLQDHQVGHAWLVTQRHGWQELFLTCIVLYWLLVLLNQSHPRCFITATCRKKLLHLKHEIIYFNQESFPETYSQLFSMITLAIWLSVHNLRVYSYSYALTLLF